MPRTRPASVTVVAILQLVFGVLGLLCHVMTGATQLVGGTPGFGQPAAQPQGGGMEDLGKRLEKAIQEKAPATKALEYATSAINLFLAVLMILSGIGLLTMRSWGWYLTIAYAILSILMTIGLTGYDLAVSLPVTQEALRTIVPKNQEEQTFLTIMQVGIYVGVVGPLVWMIYPILILILTARRSVRVALLGGGGETLTEERPEERYEEEGGWRQ
jgi:hypothetical protein